VTCVSVDVSPDMSCFMKICSYDCVRQLKQSVHRVGTLLAMTRILLCVRYLFFPFVLIGWVRDFVLRIVCGVLADAWGGASSPYSQCLPVICTCHRQPECHLSGRLQPRGELQCSQRGMQRNVCQRSGRLIPAHHRQSPVLCDTL
jgi:hypothetical protein